ncbi:hypothetical protein GCM10027068_13790 [Prescottella soli]
MFNCCLLAAAITDGSLQEMLPENLRQLDGQSYFYPNELSALVHRESTELFAVAAREAIDRGDNLIIDGTMAWKPWAEELVGQSTDAGYSVQIVDVEAPHDATAERIVSM